MLRQIIKKEFPFPDPPKPRHFVFVEANHEGGNEIEFFAEIRKRTEGVDSLNDTANTKQTGDFTKHWQAIHIEANSGMTEQLRDVEEISCTAAQIENLPGTRHIELKLANPLDVSADPT